MIKIPAKLKRFKCETDYANDGVIIHLTLFYPGPDITTFATHGETQQGMTRILQDTLNGKELTLAINDNPEPEIKLSSPDKPSSHPNAGSW